MASISKIFHTLEKKEMTIFEYEKYIQNHPYRSSIRAIRCIECGDEIVYCNGLYKETYFKHSPTPEGHGYCSLYHEGTESKTYESLLRKKLFKEEDISLNFELTYKKGLWKSLITLPPFKQRDLENHTKNNTNITIYNSYNNIEVPVDTNHFKSGELKRIGLKEFSEKIKISVKGYSTGRDISYTMDGFIPNKQIYSNLILQNYVENFNLNVNLRNVKMFTCKKLSGKIYTGKHYLIFSYENSYINISNEAKKDMSITKLELKNDSYFNYSAYDVVFNKVTDETEKFCTNRGCELVEKCDAVILWPPINSIGNYKYYKKSSTKMFIAFENESNIFELYEHDTDRLYYRVQNINATPFFVMQFNNKTIEKSNAKFNYLNENLVSLDNNSKNYYFKNGFVKEKLESGHIKLKKHEKLLSFKSPLERTIFQIKEDKEEIDMEQLKNAIWYSKKYVILKDKEFDYLVKKYKANTFIVNYLEMCMCSKKIKKAAIEVLLLEV